MGNADGLSFVSCLELCGTYSRSMDVVCPAVFDLDPSFKVTCASFDETIRS